MQIAALLSDLKSLSVCSHSAAINLVNVHKHLDDNTKTNTNTGNKSTTDNSNRVERSGSADSDAGQSQAQLQSELDAANTNQDVDLKRANDLVALHYAVKVKHQESAGLIRQGNDDQATDNESDNVDIAVLRIPNSDRLRAVYF